MSGEQRVLRTDYGVGVIVDKSGSAERHSAWNRGRLVVLPNHDVDVGRARSCHLDRLRKQQGRFRAVNEKAALLFQSSYRLSRLSAAASCHPEEHGCCILHFTSPSGPS